MDEAGCNMNSLRKQAQSSRCDSTSTIKLILYNVTVAVSQNLRLWVCVDSVGGGGPCVFKAHWHHPEAPHSTCIHLRKLFLFQGLSYTLGWCLYDIIWAFQCSSVYIASLRGFFFFFFWTNTKTILHPTPKYSNQTHFISCFRKICVKSWFEGILLDSYRNNIMQANNNTHKRMSSIEK